MELFEVRFEMSKVETVGSDRCALDCKRTIGMNLENAIRATGASDKCFLDFVTVPVQFEDLLSHSIIKGATFVVFTAEIVIDNTLSFLV